MLADQNDPRGVQGWLAVFLILLGLAAPAIWLYRLVRGMNNSPNTALALGDRWPLLQALEWGLTIACVLGCWFIVYRLFYVRIRRSVVIAIAGIWVVNLGGFLCEAMILLGMTGTPLQGFLDNGGTGQFFRPIVFNLVWAAYLLKSRRVQNTYPAGGARAEVFE